MKKLLFYIFSIAVLVVNSCVALEPDTHVTPPPANETEKVAIEFNIAVPNDGPSTKAMGNDPEIKNVMIAVFGDSGYFNEWVKAEVGVDKTEFATENTTVYKLVAKLSMSESRLRLHIIANCPNDLIDNPPISSSGGQDLEQYVMARIRSRIGDQTTIDGNTYNIEDGYWQKIVLPYGIAAETETNGNTNEVTYKKDFYGNLIPTQLTKDQFKMLSPIPLIRNFARVRVINNDANFTIEKIGLAYAPAEGVIAPILTSPYYVNAWGERVNVQTVYSGPDDHNGTDHVRLVENDNPRVPSTPTDPNDPTTAPLVPSLHLLGHELKNSDGSDKLVGGELSTFYEELFVTNYHNLLLQEPADTDPNYKKFRLITEAPYKYGGYAPSNLTFIPNPASDDDLITYSSSTTSPSYLYVYERPKPRTYAGKTEKATRIIIKGHFAGSSVSKYYPVDILDSEGNYVPLLRNNTYIVEISKIDPAAGETDLSKAPDSSGSNVSDDPKTADVNEVSDGISSIVVSYIDTTAITSGTYSVMFRFIPNNSVGHQSNKDVTLEVGYDGTTEGFIANTESTVGAALAGTSPNKVGSTVYVEMDGSSPKLYYQDGNKWKVATTDAQKQTAWSKIIYTTVGTAGSSFSVKTWETIRVIGRRTAPAGRIHRDVRINTTPIRDMEVSCKQKYVLSNTGEPEDLIIKLPADLTRSMFPLELKIESVDGTITPRDGDNLPAQSGASIISSKNGQSSYYFIKTITRQEYETLPTDGTGEKVIVTCKFKTTSSNSATTIWVANRFFTSKSDNFLNYKKRYFTHGTNTTGDPVFSVVYYGQEDVTLTFWMDRANTGSAVWDNGTIESTSRVIPRQITLVLDNLRPQKEGNNYVDSGMTQKQGSNTDFVYNVSNLASNPLTLHFTINDTASGFSAKLSTDDLQPDSNNQDFVPNKNLYEPCTIVGASLPCTIQSPRFTDTAGNTITQVLNRADQEVQFRFSYQYGNKQPVTFQLTGLATTDTRITQEGSTYTFTPVASSGDAQIITFRTTAANNTAVSLTNFAVASTQYNTPVPQSFTLQRFSYSISLPASLTMSRTGGDQTLTPTVTPANAPITWTSTNTGVATVSNGVVHPVSLGNTDIIAKIIINGEEMASATCHVTVSRTKKTGTATFNASSFNGNNTVTDNGVSVVLDANFSYSSRYNQLNGQYNNNQYNRLHIIQNGSSLDEFTITSVAFNSDSANYVPGSNTKGYSNNQYTTPIGSYSTSGAVGTWTGESSALYFRMRGAGNNNTNNIWLDSIVVTYTYYE